MKEEKSKEEILEETINKRALKIGRKVLDEMYLHGENKVEVSIDKGKIFYWSVINVGVHSVTGLYRDEIKFIKEDGLSEMSYKDFEIKKVVEK